MLKKTIAIILAAGRGTRMKSDMPKVLHEILGRPMIRYTIDSVRASGIKDIVIVANRESLALKDTVKGARVVIQKRLLGSGDAVKAAKPALRGFSGDILVICGDTPLIRPATIRGLFAEHRASKASATVLTAYLRDGRDYGRIMRDSAGKIVKITEALDAAGAGRMGEVNVGTYFFKSPDLFAALTEVAPHSDKREYFLTDVIGILREKGKAVSSSAVKDSDEMVGINTRIDLAEAVNTMKKEILEGFMASGVTIEDPASTTIYPGVKIGRDTVIYPNTFIQSDVEIGSGCRVGPFARLRPGVRLEDGVTIGNFVELVRTKVGKGTKIKHHTYLGDTIVGRNVNVGAGAITANFDGERKNRTVIEDGCFIGIGARFVAPVRIGKGATVGAGCVVLRNQNVPKGATVVGVPARVLKK